MISIGIDIAKFKHAAAVVDGEGRRLLVGFEFSNDESGFASFIGELDALEANYGNSAVCLEATGHYGHNLIRFLEAHGYVVYEVNPLLTSNWRKAMSVRKVKSDAVDAEALALWLHAGNPTRRRIPDGEAESLRSLTRHRMSLSHIAGDCKRRAVATIDVLFPEYHRFFANEFCRASIAVLGKWPGSKPLADAPQLEIAKTLREASGGKFGEEKARRLQLLARRSIGKGCDRLGFQLRQLLDFIAFSQMQIEALDSELAEIVAGSPLTTIPGIGVVCAAGIIGELGDVGRFSSAAKIVAYAGCDPTVFESGEFVGTRAHLSKRGSPYLRWYLWVAADRARRFDPVLREYYEKKRSEGKCHKVAVSAVVRKLCAIVYAVLRDGRPYRPQGGSAAGGLLV